MYEEKRDQFVGFVAWFALIAAVLYALQLFGTDAELSEQIGRLSPWIGARWHTAIKCCAVLVLAVGTALPVLFMFTDDGRLELLGMIARRVVIAVALPAIFFILGVAWYSSRV